MPPRSTCAGRGFSHPHREGGFAQSHPQLPPLIPIRSTAWIQVTAGGGRINSARKAKQAAATQEEGGAALSSFPCTPPCPILCPPHPTLSHLLLNQGLDVDLTATTMARRCQKFTGRQVTVQGLGHPGLSPLWSSSAVSVQFFIFSRRKKI